MARIARGLVALMALVALVAGVPVALIHFVGRPWPQRIPGVDIVWQSLRRGDVSDAAVVKILAILMWIAWARLTVSVIVDLIARLSGRPIPRLGALGSSQQWAGALITAIVLLGASVPRPASVAAVAAAPRPIPLELLVTDHADEIPTSAYLVQRHDSFWSIAEMALGDGSRWREIAQLNRGREVAPGVVFDGTTDHLLTGWLLVLPSSEAPAETGEATVPTPALVPSHTVVVHAGDTLSAIAGQELGDAREWPRIWDANRGRHFGSRTFDDPNLIVSGWELVVPGMLNPDSTDAPNEVDAPSVVDAASVPDAPSVVDAASVPDAPIAVETSVAVETPVADAQSEVSTAPQSAGPLKLGPVLSDAPASRENMTPRADERTSSDASVKQTASEHDRDSFPSPVGLGGAMFVASGVVASLATRRRRRLRSAGVDVRLPEPAREVVVVETLVRGIDRGESVARLDVALRAVANELVDRAPGVGVLGVLLFDDGALEMMLAGPVPSATQPWVSSSPTRWCLAADVDLVALAGAARRANQPCPALAHLGSVPSAGEVGHAELFVDLEAIGLLTIDAAPAAATDVARGIAAGIAVSPLSEVAYLVTCRLGEPHLGRPCTVAAPTLDAAIDIASDAIGTTVATTSASLSTFTLRARNQGGEAWEPAIVVASSAPQDDASNAPDLDADGLDADAELVALTAVGGRGLAVVVDRRVEGAQWVIEQQSHCWVLQPLGMVFQPVGLSADELDHVQALLDEAAQPLLRNVPVVAIREDVTAAKGEGIWNEPEWSMMVRLLGPVEVCESNGRVAEFERSKALELVVWLSQHRERSTRTAARTALWELNVRDATFANVVSDARRALGRLVPVRDGGEWISRTLTEHLPLHPALTTDAELLRLRLARARDQPVLDAINTLRPGVALVRDMPFFGTSYLWPDAEGITSQLTLLVTSSATVLAELYLSLGDIDGVFWATGQGLKVLAGHEELIALRMRAHARQGDLAGVRQEWESYERALIADPWSSGDPAPKLVSLRRELLSLSLLQSA